jgi:outer membrane protein
MNCPVLLLACAFWLTLLPQSVTAAEPLRLTLPAAVNLALSDNPAMLLARNQQESAQVSVRSARGTFLPDLKASAGASTRYSQQPPPFDDVDSRSMNLGISSSLNLFNGFADSAGLDSARRQLDAVSAGLLRQQQTTAYDVAVAYIVVLGARELVTVAEESLAREVALLNQVEAFYQAGVRSVTDFYQQQAAKAQAELDLLDAQRNLEVVQLKLVQSLGQLPPFAVDPQPVDTQILVDALQGLEPTTALNMALKLRPDLIAQNWQVEAAREAIQQSRAGNLPRLDLTAAANTGYSSLNSGRDVGSQLSRDQGEASLGLTLSVPLFDRSQTSSNVAQAQIAERNASVEVQRLQQQIGVEVGQALADYHHAELKMTVSRTKLEAARQALEASEARYRAGASSWVDRTAARATFVSAQGDEVRARYALLQQGLAVGYARGDLDTLLTRFNPA